jgi:hypothetical protein
MKMCAKCGGSMKKGGTMKKMQNGGPNNLEKKIGRLENKKERLANKSSRAQSISRNFLGDPDTLSKVVDNALQKRAMNVMEKVSNKREMINKKIEELKSSNASSSMKKVAKGGVQKYQPGGSTGENPNPSGKSFGKQAGVFGGALAALVGLTREKGIERRAKKAEERYDKRQVKKQVKAEIKEAKNMPKSKMGGMTKSKKK